MSFGKMNGFIDIIQVKNTKDSAGFSYYEEEVLQSNVRCYKEGRHGSVKWANLSAFSMATDLFCFRVIPNFEVTCDMTLIYKNERFEILSVEDVKGRGMYIEVQAKKVEALNGKGNGQATR